MKVAICFYGYLRSFKQTSQSIFDHLIAPYDCDVYMYHPNLFYAAKSYDPAFSQEQPEHATFEHLSSAFKHHLKSAVLFENNHKLFIDKVEQTGIPKDNFIGQLTWRSYGLFDNIRTVLNLRRSYESLNGIKYDAVMLARPDLQIHEKVNLEAVDLSKVSYGPAHEAPTYHMPDRKFGDHTMISRPENIDAFITLYDRVEEYCNQDKLIPNNEGLMSYHLHKHGIDWECKDYIKHSVIR